LEKENQVAPAEAEDMDTSVSNLASIVVIAEVEGKSALLSGDARGDMIIEWLEEMGELQPGESRHFDIVKLPHHGSDRNVTPEFFSRITADHYVVSGNGGHGNPEPHMFEMLFSARPELNYQLHLTYSPEELYQHKKFIKEGNVEKMQQVIRDTDDADIFQHPRPGDMYIDISV